MNRRLIAWFVSTPVIVAGVEAGHWLTYRLVYPDPYTRQQALASTGHGYLDYAPLFFSVLAAIVLCAFWLQVLGREPERRDARASATSQVSLLPFLIAAPLAFALQECLERLLVGGWPFAAVLAPTFMPGLAFELPFALAAFLIARFLLRAADRLRTLVVRGVARQFVAMQICTTRVVHEAELPRLAALAFGVGERGPPAAYGPASARFV